MTGAPAAPIVTKTKSIMVVGECGDGKSTLVTGIKDDEREAAAGLKAGGCTKHIFAYKGKTLSGGVEMIIYDTPGVGDMEVTPVKLLSMIEAMLGTNSMTNGGLDGVVVTSPITDGRIKLGAQVVQTLVDKGFVGGDQVDKWQSIILCGTKMDRATPDEIKMFNGEVTSIFFSKGPTKTGPTVLTHKGDYEPLMKALADLPSVKIQYEKPDEKVMANALADTLGIEKKAFEEELAAMRTLVQKGQETMNEVMEETAKKHEQCLERSLRRRRRPTYRSSRAALGSPLRRTLTRRFWKSSTKWKNGD